MRSWPTAALGVVVDVRGGGTPRRTTPEFYGGAVPWVTPKDMKSSVISDSLVRLTDSGVENSPAKLIPAGSVLVVVRSGVLKHTLPIALTQAPVTVNQDMKALTPRGCLSGPYLARLLKARSNEILSWVRATTADNFPIGKLLEMQIPLPPIEEQRRIAAILDQADTLRAKRREALTHLDDLTQSIFLDMFGDPVANHFGWPREPLSSFLTSIDSGQSPVCLARAAEPDEWAVLKLGAVTYGRFDAAANKALPPGFAPRAELEVRPGDLLFTRKNTADLVGATALVGATRPKLLLPDLIFRLNFRDSAEVRKDYLHCLLMWPSKRKKIQGLANGSAGSMPNISKAKLRNVPIELPPMRVQQEFAERLAGLERAKLALQEQAVGFNELFSALQAQAFVGDL